MYWDNVCHAVDLMGVSVIPTRGSIVVSETSADEVARVMELHMAGIQHMDRYEIIEGGTFRRAGKRGVFNIVARPRNPFLRLLPLVLSCQIDYRDSGATVRYTGGLTPLALIPLLSWMLFVYVCISAVTQTFPFDATLWWAYLLFGIVPVIVAQRLTRSTVREMVRIVMDLLPGSPLPPEPTYEPPPKEFG